MDNELLAALREHRISFHSPPSESRFGIGRVRVPIVFEPFVELREGPSIFAALMPFPI